MGRYADRKRRRWLIGELTSVGIAWRSIGVRDGTIVSHRTCATYDEALRAVGVEPAEDAAG